MSRMRFERSIPIEHGHIIECPDTIDPDGFVTIRTYPEGRKKEAVTHRVRAWWEDTPKELEKL